MTMNIDDAINLNIEQDDILSFEADVIALKYAQSFHGVDRKFAQVLTQRGKTLDELCPIVGDYRYLETGGCGVGAKYCLLVGTLPLYEFGYKQIREFSTNVLNIF